MTVLSNAFTALVGASVAAFAIGIVRAGIKVIKQLEPQEAPSQEPDIERR
jgi:hypothetical protein